MMAALQHHCYQHLHKEVVSSSLPMIQQPTLELGLSTTGLTCYMASSTSAEVFAYYLTVSVLLRNCGCLCHCPVGVSVCFCIILMTYIPSLYKYMHDINIVFRFVSSARTQSGSIHVNAYNFIFQTD